MGVAWWLVVVLPCRIDPDAGTPLVRRRFRVGLSADAGAGE